MDGVVTDPSQAVIAGAQVTLTNAATGVATRQTSDAAGEYVFPFVLPGSYNLAASFAGFEMWTKQVVVHANDHIAVDITMIVGSTKQTVNVTASDTALADARDKGLGLTP